MRILGSIKNCLESEGVENMIENKNIDFPPELHSVFRSRVQTALSLLDKSDFNSAEQEYRNLLSEIFSAQGTTTRYHKGGVYHQIGYCLFLQKKTQDALLYFEYAFIEDCIRVSGFEARQLPAYYNLCNVYRISAKQLEDLLNRIKHDMNRNIPLDAEKYLKSYIDSGGKLDSIAVIKKDNVFIGGNYKNIALLRYIADKVRECEFSSIMAIDFDVMSNEYVYADAMALLQDCGSAIFEVTFDGGHLMEIERAINSQSFSKKNILLLFQKSEKPKEPYISKMLLGVEIKIEYYAKIEELQKMIKMFLGKIRQDI